MTKIESVACAATACALLLAIPVTAAQRPNAKTGKTMASAPASVRSVWPPETLAGKITLVDPAAKLMVVEGPGGVPFDMVVTSKTRIESGNRALKLQDLTQRTNQSVSVKFIPERRGDVAESIRVTG